MLNTANQVCSICRDARRKGDVARAPASFVNRIRSVAAASIIAICVLTLPGMAHAAITYVALASNPGDTGNLDPDIPILLVMAGRLKEVFGECADA